MCISCITYIPYNTCTYAHVLLLQVNELKKSFSYNVWKNDRWITLIIFRVATDSTSSFTVFRMLPRTQKHFSPFTHLSRSTRVTFSRQRKDTNNIRMSAALEVMMHSFDAISHPINSSTRSKFDKKVRQECTWSVSLFEICTYCSSPTPLVCKRHTLLASLFTALSSPVTLFLSSSD